MGKRSVRTIKLPQLAWFGVKELELSLPAEWEIEVYNMAGFSRPALPAEDIARALAAPVGCPPLRELAWGKKEVVIIFDDLTRVTRVSEIVPFILAELAAAGVPEGGIRFVAALGCHRAMDRLDFIKKLGAEVVERYPVYNHNPFANCVDIGATGSGLRVEVNAEVMGCDLKIAVGAVTPHIMTGFGGGGKIILPGISSIRTAAAFHRLEKEAGRGRVNRWMGVIEGNPLRDEVAEACQLAGLDFKVECLVNSWGETVAVFAGEPLAVHAVAVKEARRHYLTPGGGGCEVVIANTFAKANEALSGLPTAWQAVGRNGGDVVLIANAPDGQAVHYLMGTFGKNAFGELRLKAAVPPFVGRLIVFTEYPDPAGRGCFDPDERILFLSRWDEVLNVLTRRHGTGARVGVYPNADIQYSP
ncbi:MAG: lactate racemase domain-containing protein [Armatimonadetes bacterium]|nr:lactate racemase domain-containing protein [Armatimonadota bacterium]